MRDESIARLKLIKNGIHAIEDLPLAYLFSKEELRPFAIERAARVLIKPALVSVKMILAHAFSRWRYAPASLGLSSLAQLLPCVYVL